MAPDSEDVAKGKKTHVNPGDIFVKSNTFAAHRWVEQENLNCIGQKSESH